ncbi:hypothetical protein [Mycobacterium sp. SMC-4]|uniref:hypothetical protein n=1 Tax=Mycobacterium sp. SMC-4 TaxID=2857059 RepID=UPI003D05E156
MSALPLPATGTSTAGHVVRQWMSFVLRTAVTQESDGAARVPRHYPGLRSAFMEHSAMQREMGRL